MNKVRKAGLLILGIYCMVMAMGFSAPAKTYSNDKLTRHSTFSFEISNLLSLTISSDKSYEGLGRIPAAHSKINFGDYLSSIKTAETKIEHLHSRYLTFARDKVIRFQPWEIIFPFHHFL